MFGREYAVQKMTGPCRVYSFTARKCLNCQSFLMNSCCMVDFTRIAAPSYASFGVCLQVYPMCRIVQLLVIPILFKITMSG